MDMLVRVAVIRVKRETGEDDVIGDREGLGTRVTWSECRRHKGSEGNWEGLGLCHVGFKVKYQET